MTYAANPATGAAWKDWMLQDPTKWCFGLTVTTTIIVCGQSRWKRGPIAMQPATYRPADGGCGGALQDRITFGTSPPSPGRWGAGCDRALCAEQY